MSSTNRVKKGKPRENLVVSPIGADSSKLNNPAALPRPKRKRHRDRADRSLAPDADLRALARAYLKGQAELWPDLAERQLIPASTDVVIDDLVQDYKARHRTGKVDPAAVDQSIFGKLLLGGFYGRYKVRQRIARLLKPKKLTVPEIAQRVGCSTGTVYRVKKKLESKGAA